MTATIPSRIGRLIAGVATPEAVPSYVATVATATARIQDSGQRYNLARALRPTDCRSEPAYSRSAFPKVLKSQRRHSASRFFIGGLQWLIIRSRAKCGF